MSDATAQVLAHLTRVGFHSRSGPLAPFDEELPLVTGVAWDVDTAQLALLAEWSADDSDDAWRQLLFAASGLRHQLAGDRAAAFGPPVVLAIVDDEGERRLRDLAEDLSERYALFNRIDLNLVRGAALEDDDTLDLALAPLLPKCRTLLGQEISYAEVQRFWGVLRAEVMDAALELDDVFAPYREAAGRAGADALIGDPNDRSELPAPAPVRTLTLRNFRSFADAQITLEPITVLHGPNGGGKTSIVEALEIAWAGRSQRQPEDVETHDYARHLPRDGDGDFEVRRDEDAKASVADQPRAELRRSVLGQDTLGDLVSAAPDERYASLLALTGLEIPDLSARTDELVANAKREVDVVLSAAGLQPLRRRDSDGLKHLREALRAGFASRLPATADLVALEATVADASRDTFEGWPWHDGQAAEALARADAIVAGALDGDSDSDVIVEVLDAARDAVDGLVALRHRAAAGVRGLLGLLLERTAAVAPSTEDAASREELPSGVAVRWLAHGRAIADAAERFRTDAADLSEHWQTGLLGYVEALERAAEAVPRTELERIAWTTPERERGDEPAHEIDESAFRRAGFSATPASLEIVQSPLVELLAELDRQADALMALSAELDQHPARTFAEHAPRVLRALCRFQLARKLRRAGPIKRASEQIVEELLQGRLAPVLRELVAAIVRFEWYFKPLHVSEEGRAVVLGGLATSKPDLDARLLLNAAERTVVGVAWFLALHLLQPASRRRVLVLDDPTGAFDLANQAGFVSTLRAFVRLTHPEQIVVTTHDDALAAVLAEELAPVDQWPAGVARIRCQRDSADASVARPEWIEAASRATSEESARLGLEGEATLFA